MNAVVEPAPFYRATGDEEAVFGRAFEAQLPLLLKGPTGCGKSRFVEKMARTLGRPLITVACHDDTSATDLLGRYLVQGGDTVWQDGPVTRAVREGAILYLDEIAEARDDVVVVLHPLTDHRREVYLDRRDETVRAAAGFLLVASFNPGYQRGFKELKPSTRQRFVTVAFGYPTPEIEAEVIVAESRVELAVAKRLVVLGNKIRRLETAGLRETVSTRLLVQAARMIAAGLAPRSACRVGIVESLTDDASVREALLDLANLAF